MYTISRKCRSLARYAILTLILASLLASIHMKSNSIISAVSSRPGSSSNCSGKETKYAAVMFHSDAEEFRSVLQNLISHLSDKWVVRLFIPWRDDEEYFRFNQTKERILKMDVVNHMASMCVRVDIRRHDVSDLPVKYVLGLHGTTDSGPLIANHFALSKTTYQMIKEPQILLFQQDAAFCSGANRTLESFMHHEYLGAPWLGGRVLQDQNGKDMHVTYGNGGLSVRSKRFVMFCIELPQYHHDLEAARKGQGLPEDLFFSRCLFEHFKDAINVDEARAFAAEEHLEPRAFTFLAVHDPCRTADQVLAVGCSSKENKNTTRDLINMCPESRRIIAKCVAQCGFGEP
mmetsp:Transcript_7684/g.32040  ORF Transcript_7684/g.32040 Transcript_7684/m.32040 type:complete len:346 (+) Transcript_7684:215-1252(+)